MAYLAHELLERGVLEPPLYANVILGSPNTAPATAGALAQLVRGLPPGTLWAAGGLGAFELPVNAIALFMGGHVRTGLEDNPAMDAQRREPARNAALVARVAGLAGVACGRPARRAGGRPPAPRARCYAAVGTLRLRVRFAGGVAGVTPVAREELRQCRSPRPGDLLGRAGGDHAGRPPPRPPDPGR